MRISAFHVRRLVWSVYLSIIAKPVSQLSSLKRKVSPGKLVFCNVMKKWSLMLMVNVSLAMIVNTVKFGISIIVKIV
jgi:hypothetical protein